eukprot:Cvel_25986.t1-p1 / transcript=Cvel_25986.t1 / gene=Cvel_25986 / organism=Chromera_velia_CCMP2878 / gene_product=Chromodomain-helicase-DNA-binding protein 9, putative / transcript_product=Chromodomain-helicase-DNA-binding protein 9, putative / location=Cvel_scaffold3020:243-17204(-) / protein_length=1212 / sequence_SO=supercontig / SO=protein_coding / is_pseudo=false
MEEDQQTAPPEAGPGPLENGHAPLQQQQSGNSSCSPSRLQEGTQREIGGGADADAGLKLKAEEKGENQRGAEGGGKEEQTKQEEGQKEKREEQKPPDEASSHVKKDEKEEGEVKAEEGVKQEEPSVAEKKGKGADRDTTKQEGQQQGKKVKQEQSEESWDFSLGPHEPIANHYARMKLPHPPPPGVSRFYALSPLYKNNRRLFDYQVDGLNWLLAQWSNGRNGILADEMGLGKTIQAVAFLWHLVHRERMRGPFLVVAPLSTLGHWRRTAEEWTDMNCVLYHDGGGRLGREALRDLEWYYETIEPTTFVRVQTPQTAAGKPASSGIRPTDVRLMRTEYVKFHLLLTSYELLRDDIEELAAIPWQFVVIDEAHRLKNTAGRALNALRTLPCRQFLLLSGTPLQNSTTELWSLLNVMEPVKFPSRENFIERFGKLQERRQVAELHTLIRPHLLRRTKEDVLPDIPPMEETIIDVEMTPLQKAYYRAVFDRNRGFLVRAGSRGGGGGTAGPSLMNVEIELRKTCNHPFQLSGVEDRELGNCTTDEERFRKLLEASGKLVLLDKLLPKLKAEGHKVLVFSQFIHTLNLLEHFLVYKNWAFERLDGSVRGVERQQAIQRFNDPASNRFVFLLSTRAGGLGINLTSADTVVIFDSDWNPQNDVQATARCHRIGQTRDVKVYRLVTARTYEAQMFERASKKLGLNTAVFHKGAFQAEGGGGGAEEGVGISAPSKEEIEELLRHGAYVLREAHDHEKARDFQQSGIDDILSKNVRMIKYGGGSSFFSKASFKPDSGGAGGGDWGSGDMAEGPSRNLAEIDQADPDFWEKMLGAGSVAQFISRLNDGSAVSSKESKQKFFLDIQAAVDTAVNLSAEEGEYLISALVQMGQTREFTPDVRQQASAWLMEVQSVQREKQMAMSGALLPSRRGRYSNAARAASDGGLVSEGEGVVREGDEEELEDADLRQDMDAIARGEGAGRFFAEGGGEGLDPFLALRNLGLGRSSVRGEDGDEDYGSRGDMDGDGEDDEEVVVVGGRRRAGASKRGGKTRKAAAANPQVAGQAAADGTAGKRRVRSAQKRLGWSSGEEGEGEGKPSRRGKGRGGQGGGKGRGGRARKAPPAVSGGLGSELIEGESAAERHQREMFEDEEEAERAAIEASLADDAMMQQAAASSAVKGNGVKKQRRQPKKTVEDVENGEGGAAGATASAGETEGAAGKRKRK